MSFNCEWQHTRTSTANCKTAGAAEIHGYLHPTRRRITAHHRYPTESRANGRCRADGRRASSKTTDVCQHQHKG
eukprot:14936675-Alexandrium_andersonii.AAC.1